MSRFDKLRRKAQTWAKENPEQVEKVSDSVLHRGGNLLDTATGGKYTDKITKARQKADEKLGRTEREATIPPPGPGPSPDPGPAPAPGPLPDPQPGPEPAPGPDPSPEPQPMPPGSRRPDSSGGV